MRVLFFGSPPFAAHILEALVREEAVSLAAIVTKPDAPQGRNLRLAPPAVKAWALEHLPSVPILQSENCSSPESVEALAQYKADLFVVVAYGEILRQAVLDLAPLGSINVHASLLPHLRGAAPIQRALMCGDSKTGITIIRLVRKMDAGDILHQVEMPIGPLTTAGELERELVLLGTKALVKVIRDFVQGTVLAYPQDETMVTFAPKIVPGDSEIDWTKEAESVHNQVRALSPRPGASCLILYKGEKKRLKVLRTEPVQGVQAPSGSLVEMSKNRLLVACGKDAVSLLEVQLEGKPVLPIAEFLRGIVTSQFQI